MFELAVEKRDKIGKATKRREGGKIPAVFYGPKETATPISLSEKDFLAVWKKAGESSVVDLTGLGDTKETLIQDVDFDPVSGRVRHADFYVMEKGKKVEVQMPLTFVGESPAVKDLGGILVKVMHEITIEVMPKDLPKEISVDISKLVDFETQIHVSDIPVSSEITVVGDKDEVVALISVAKEEEEVETPGLDSIEVEKKGKEEGEETPTDGGETKTSEAGSPDQS